MSDKPMNQKAPMNFILALVGAVVGGALVFAITKMGVGSSVDPVVAKLDGKAIHASQAFEEIKTRVFDLDEEMYQLKERAISDYVERELLKIESQKQNLPEDKLIEKEVGSETVEVSDKEIEEFLAAKGIKLDDPRIRKEDVKDYLVFKGRHEKRQTYLAKLKEKSKVEVLIKEPESPKVQVATDGFPSWGSSSAPVTIVEFSDYQCPFCSRAVPTLNQIKQEYGPDKVRMVFRDMPLPSHGRANPASLAALCANEQGKFWEYHDTLFENQTQLEDEDLKKYATKVGLDAPKFEECYKSQRHQALIDRSSREAQSVGIQATPSFIINGTLLQGAQPFEKFKEKIDKALKGRS